MRSPNHVVAYVPPDEADIQTCFRAMRAAIEASEHARVPLSFRLKQFISEALHPLGVHHWVVGRVYDKRSGKLVELGGEVCLVCHRMVRKR